MKILSHLSKLVPPAGRRMISAVGAGIGGLVALLASPALAGTSDTTFSALTTNVTTWTTGSLGKGLAVITLLAGIIASVIRFQWVYLGAAVILALAASVGPGIVSGIFGTALI
jgi:conjugal transfer pilus assembly protein TraA